MKATQGTTYRMLGQRLNDITNQLETLRKIGASGKKLNSPSDNPSAIRPVLDTRKQLSNVDRYMETMGQSLDKMNAMDGQLSHVENILVSAKETAINAANGTMAPSDMQTLADKIDNLIKELADTSNTVVDGKYVFAGYQEDTKPFTANGAYVAGGYDPTNSATWPYSYNGDENPTFLEISAGETIQVNVTGNELFLGDANNDGSVDPGKVNMFAVLTNLKEAIQNQDLSGIETGISDLEVAADQNRQIRSQMGNNGARVESAMDHQEQVRIDLQQILSRYQDADVIDAFNSITQQETAYQAALSITGKVSGLSILNYL